MSKTVLILGGYGNTGRLIAELLIRESNVRLILAGRNIEKARAAADALNRRFNDERVSAVQADAAVPESLAAAVHKVDLAVAASSTSAYVQNMAQAVLNARIDYLDTQLSSDAKLKVLRAVEPEIRKAGCCFITDGGFHPGVPAALIRYAGHYFDRILSAYIGSVIQINWKKLTFSDATVGEMTEELRHFQPLLFKDGKWVRTGWNFYKTFDFGSCFGKRDCIPMFLEELRFLPEIFPDLKDTGFFVGGFNWFADYIVMPLGMTVLALWPQKAKKPFGSLFEFSLRAFSKPPYGTMLRLEATGWKHGRKEKMSIELFHEDGYAFTAIPVTACLLQYLDGSIRKPGLGFQAIVVEPRRFLSDMERMGVTVNICCELLAEER